MNSREIRIEMTEYRTLRWGGSIASLALLAFLIFPSAHAVAQTAITLGPTTLTDGTYDTASANQVTEQGSLTQSGSTVYYSFTNNTGASLLFTPQTFSWYSTQNPLGGLVQGEVTPYVMLVQNTNLEANNSQQLLAYGDLQANAASGLQSAAFYSGPTGPGYGSGNTFDLLPGQEIAIGFIDAYVDGSSGTGPVIPFVNGGPSGGTWYNSSGTLGNYNGRQPTTTLGTVIGGPSTASVSRAYQFNVTFNYVGADQGAWTGLTSGTLDNTTQNFALNMSNSALSLGSLTDVQNDPNISAIIFGDTYYSSGTAARVAQSNLTVAAGGISPTLPMYFTNNSVNYTVNSSDGIGISGSTSLSLLGTGTVTLTGSHTYTGSTTISAGTLQLGDGTTSAHDASLTTSSIVNNAALVYNVFGSVAPAYPIGGSGVLIKAGNGTLTLTPSNSTYTGSTIVSSGTLQVGNGASGSDGSLTNSNIVDNAALAYNVFASQTASYPISGGGSLTKLGSGTLTVSGSNTYGGGTAVNAGTLDAAMAPSLPGYSTTGSVTVAGGAVLAVQSGSGAIGWSGAQIDSLRSSASWTSKTSGLGIDTTNGNFTYGSNITQALSLTKLGANTLTLTGVNTYSGNTTVNAGTLSAPNPTSLPGAGSGTPNPVTVGSGASLDLQTGNGTTGWSSGQIQSLVANTTFSDSTSSLGIDTTNGSFTYGNSITKTLALTKLGPNALTLTAANTYSGLTTVSGGTLQLGDGTQGDDGSIAGKIVNNAALVYNLYGSQVYSGQISGNGSLTKTGTGTLTLNGNSSYTGPTVITAGTLRMQPQPGIPSGAVAAYTFADGATATDVSGNGNNGALNNSPTFMQPGPSGPNSWAVSLDGTSQWISVPYSSSLANLTSYTVSSWVNLSSNSAAGTNGLVGTRFNGDTTYDLKIQGNNTAVHSDIGSGNGWLNTAADGGYAFSSGSWYMVTETVSSGGYSLYVDGSLIGSGGSAALNGTPLFMKSGQTLGIGQDYPGEFFSGSLSDVYIYGRTLSQNDVTTLYNSVVAPGLTAANALPSGTPLTIAANGKLDLNGFNQQVVSLSDYVPGTGGSVINSNSTATAILTLSPIGSSATFSGAIQGPVNLVMNGNGTQVLAGSNSYTGGTTVEVGELETVTAASLPGYSTSGSVTVSGGTLAVLAGGANGWSGSQIGQLVASTTWSNSAATLGIDTSNGSVTYGGSITQNQKLSLAKLGPNTLTLTGSNTYPGLTTIGGGTLQLGNGTPNFDGSIAGNIVNNSALVYNLSGNQTYSGIINGGGSVTKAGSGTLTLSNFNNYGGPTVITAGTLKMQPVAALPPGAVAAYTFADGATATDVSGNGNNGTLNNSPTFVQGPSGPGSYAVSLDGATQWISVPYSSSLSNLNSWTASAWINLSTSASNQTNGIIGTRIPGGNYDHTYDVKINPNLATVHSDIGTGNNAGTTWLNTGADATYAPTFTPNQWYMVTETVASSGYDIYVNGSLIGSGPVGNTPLFMKAGQTMGIGLDAGTGQQGATGEFFNGSLADVYVYGQALTSTQIGLLYNSVVAPNSASNALPIGTPVTIAANANLDLNGYNQQVASLSDSAAGVGGNVINSNAAITSVLTLSATGGSTTFSGAIQGPINLVMSGSGTQVLAGSNTYTGGTTVNGGILEPATPAALPGYSTTGSVNVAGGVLAIPTSGTAGSGWSSAQIDNLLANPNVNWNNGAGALGINTSNGDFSYGSNITQALSLIKLGPHTLTLTGSNTYPGLTTISGGTLQLGNGTPGHDGVALTGNILNNSALVYNLSGSQLYYGLISGSGSVTKSGSGMLTLGSANSYGGPTVISGGTLQIQNNSSTPAVVNGSFASPNIGANNYLYYGSMSTGQQAAFVWTSGGNVSGQGGAVVNGNSAFGFNTAYPVGQQAFSLQET
ncbi:MAG: beta strand repeat-containing protein, partial [Thermoguttaceae bacterium]